MCTHVSGFIVPLCNVYLESVGRREYTFPVPWSSYISRRPGRTRYSVSSKIDIRTSSCLSCLQGGRRRWASTPKAVEPGARGSSSQRTRWCGWLASPQRLPDFAGRLLRSPPRLLLRRSSRPLLGFLYGGINYCWRVLPCGLNSSTMALTLAPFLERSPSLMIHFVGVSFTPNNASGSTSLGAASLGRNGLRPWAVCVVLPRLEDNCSGRWFRLPLFS